MSTCCKRSSGAWSLSVPDAREGGVTLGRRRTSPFVLRGPRRGRMLSTESIRQRSGVGLSSAQRRARLLALRSLACIGTTAVLHTLAPALLSATDESQGGWSKDFGGRIGRVAGVGGLRSPAVSSVRRAGAISVGFCPNLRRSDRRPGWLASGPAVRLLGWARVTDVAKCRRQELSVCRAAMPLSGA